LWQMGRARGFQNIQINYVEWMINE
jgi:hypothetical protein